MIKPGELQSIAGKEGVRDTQIEKDYVISWVTYGIANNPFLKENLVFKGGTVLKKVYFPNYRFSEDLDFTFTGKAFDIHTIKAAFNELIEWVYEESRISLSVQNEMQHTTGNFNFYLSYTGPLGGAGTNKDIKVDISKDELIYYTPEEKKIINTYSDLEKKYSTLCYSLGEVIAEKMRSILQRTAPRDIYDLWYLFEVEGQKIEDHIFAFQDKTKMKDYDPNKLINVIEQKEKIFAKHWKDHLANQMTEIPDFPDVWRQLTKHWRKFQKFSL
ncbi:MAG: nucleotidyl transferase AbiEii/AbiGii toxin family protein [Chitinophagaceae bacterium]|nr:nucleotidyl transferase AbiEii/AbiGii toxin family protein [Chitinophagaceae bacterium]MCB0740717.1 nucleotidyl transferase AbiEii/AbiGii toxin family protein [Chitinophagaceae bacterium]